MGAVEEGERALPDQLEPSRHHRLGRRTLQCAGERRPEGRLRGRGRLAKFTCWNPPAARAACRPAPRVTSVAGDRRPCSGDVEDRRRELPDHEGRVVARHRELLRRDVRERRPSQRVCSRLTDVSTCTFEGITFVASKRPPRPASITATSTP